MDLNTCLIWTDLTVAVCEIVTDVTTMVSKINATALKLQETCYQR